MGAALRSGQGPTRLVLSPAVPAVSQEKVEGELFVFGNKDEQKYF